MRKKTDHAPGKLVPVTLKRLGDGWHADGGNLYLFIRGNSRTWVFRYTGPDGKRKNMGLGSLEAITLADARRLAAELRAKLKDPATPTDPLAERQAAKAARRMEEAKRMTFKACAEAFMEAKRHEWKNAKHGQQWENTLDTYVYPTLGTLPVGDIDTALVVKVLQPIWTTKNETASRLRGRIESILAWATTSGYRTGENPARWRGHLSNLLATPSKVQKVEHHAALPYAEMGRFMRQLRAAKGTGARALEFVILTAARSGEVRGATWDEIDLEGRVWCIPGARMKAGRDHRVPLSEAAVALLQALPRFEGCPLVFPSSKSTPLSDMTMTAVLRRMDRGDITAHGFRSTFRDWVAETTHYPRDVAEMCLAHTIENEVEAAYRRGDMLAKRANLMQAWADYCGTDLGEAGNVVPMRGAA